MDNNSNQFGIPSINEIPDLPKVDLPAVDADPASAQPSVATSVQSSQPVAAQPVQPAPTQQAPSASTYSYNYSYAPAANYYQTLPTEQAKRTGGQIAALVIGIILLVIFVPFSLFLLLGDAVSGFQDPVMSVVMHGIFLLPNILGVVLVVIGNKKKNAVVNPVAQQPYTAPVQAAPVAQPYAAPVQTAPVAQPYTVPVQAAPVTQTNTAPVTTASVPAVSDTQATPAVGVTPTAAPQPAGNETVSNPATYDYAPTQIIGDDSQKAAKKSARSAALVSMAIVVGLWVVILIVLFGFDRWWFPWYLFILTIITPIGAIRTCPKSALAWISLILSILSIVAFIFMTTQLMPYFA